jgi:two-component system OmpR family response regulator
VPHAVSDSCSASSDGPILLVEDEPTIRDVVQALLEDEGHVVAATKDGTAAVAWAEQYRPALVILDLGLPLLDGVAVATILRARYGDRLPIVVFSADQQARARTRHLAPCDLVRKPFDADVLVAAVRRGLAGS